MYKRFVAYSSLSSFSSSCPVSAGIAHAVVLVGAQGSWRDSRGVTNTVVFTARKPDRSRPSRVVGVGRRGDTLCAWWGSEGAMEGGRGGGEVRRDDTKKQHVPRVPGWSTEAQVEADAAPRPCRPQDQTACDTVSVREQHWPW